MIDKTITISIALTIAIMCVGSFIAGLYQAPQPMPFDETDNVQLICDKARQEPWKAEHQAACDYLQQWWNIQYKCEEVIGCHTLAQEG